MCWMLIGKMNFDICPSLTSSYTMRVDLAPNLVCGEDLRVNYIFQNGRFVSFRVVDKGVKNGKGFAWQRVVEPTLLVRTYA